MADIEENKTESKQKAKIVKKSRPSEIKIQPAGSTQQNGQADKEKKRVVLVKKKTLVVKAISGDKDDSKSAAAQDNSSVKPEVAPVVKETAKDTDMANDGGKDKTAQDSISAKGQKGHSEAVNSQSGESSRPSVSAQDGKPSMKIIKKGDKVIDLQNQTIIGQRKATPVQVKKVVKKTSAAANTVINNGPVIISGANLPPIFPKMGGKSDAPRSTGPVGSVGGVNYGKDGKVVKVKHKGAPDKKPLFGSYTPRGNQKGPFKGDSKKDGAGTFKPGFSSSGRGNNFAPQSIPDGKNKRVYSKDKGRDRRHEQMDDEMELKQFGRKKSSEPQAVVAKSIEIMSSITVGDLAKKMNIKASEIIGKLLSQGEMVSINQSIDSDTASLIASEYGCEVKIIDLYEETVIEKEADREEDLVPRAPIVTVMGHVDHGKTRLLDTIRKSNVIEGEFGGITQHVGAYRVTIPGKRDVVFLDTPGHEAFTLMRARGAQMTDIVVLVVAATEGVMPQTKEAIDHAKAAGVPIIVAINKVDLPEAKPERVMQQLSDLGLMPEEWGGSTLYCKISAKQNFGIFRPILEEETLPADLRQRLVKDGDHSDGLLDTILLQADMMELKANPNVRAEGKIIDAKIDQGRGIVASVMIQRGTLHQGDNFVAGIYAGRVRAMFDDKGKKIKEAGPSTPVEITGLSDTPFAGDPLQVCEDEKQARMIGAKRQELERFNKIGKNKIITLGGLFDKMREGEIKELNLIIKGDVQGSVEALKMELEKLSNSEVRVHVIHSAAGAIIENDVNLAAAGDNHAIIIGFNVRPTSKAQERADKLKIEIRKYNVIYHVVDDVKAALKGLLSPNKTEEEVGSAQVRQVFKVPKVGLVAGCMVLSGSVRRNCFCKVVRDSIQLSKDLLKIASLKRFKDDVREVTAGFECGIGIENFQDLREGDIIEFIQIVETERELEDIPSATPKTQE